MPQRSTQVDTYCNHYKSVAYYTIQYMDQLWRLFSFFLISRLRNLPSPTTIRSPNGAHYAHPTTKFTGPNDVSRSCPASWLMVQFAARGARRTLPLTTPQHGRWYDMYVRPSRTTKSVDVAESVISA